MEDQEKSIALNHGTILKELSDIKSSLAVNTAETANIKLSITEIKNDIREIKQDFVNRREFKEGLDGVREEISPIRKIVYGLVGLFGVSVVGAVMKVILKI